MWYQWRSDERSNSGNILKVDGLGMVCDSYRVNKFACLFVSA